MTVVATVLRHNEDQERSREEYIEQDLDPSSLREDDQHYDVPQVVREDDQHYDVPQVIREDDDNNLH
jgi:hypothetical protein